VDRRWPISLLPDGEFIASLSNRSVKGELRLSFVPTQSLASLPLGLEIMLISRRGDGTVRRSRPRRVSHNRSRKAIEVAVRLMSGWCWLLGVPG
jgi:hypothetical protein